MVVQVSDEDQKRIERLLDAEEMERIQREMDELEASIELQNPIVKP